MNTFVKKLITFLIFNLYTSGAAFATVAQTPLFLTTSVDPNVLFNMSVETPMGGAAYTDQPDPNTGCAGRTNDGGTVGICYFPNQEYLGYFDPKKCYDYSAANTRFEPSNNLTNANHECSSQFSGNFLNWASMTAMDMFVWTMTGGNRVVDGADNVTVIRRTRKQNVNSWFPHKLISATHNVAPSTVTPWSDSKIYIYNTDFGIQFGTSFNGSQKGTYEAMVRVCDKNRQLEANCVPYNNNSYYKPEGLVQENANSMRFGVTSYSNTSAQSVDGGVLRSNMKYTGPTMPDGSGGTMTNPLAETRPDGTINTNANPADALASGVSLSGVITYLNKFSDSGYKGFDPASELFYESIRYFKNLGPTSEYLSGANGGFPILASNRWEDPIQYHCQSNFIVGINDANPWADKRLPGTHFTSSASWPNAKITNDFGQPSTPDAAINVTSLTNTVGDLEGLTGTSQIVGCTALNCDFANTPKIIPGLGEVMGTYPYTPKENSYYIAGLAYYANTQDIRTGASGTQNFPGKQTISTFMVDSQEYSATPLLGQMNMLWLAGKYGGFTDVNGDNNPNVTEVNGVTVTSDAEWDANGDGEPDNYVLATEPAKLVNGLSQAFATIQQATSSAASAATNSSRLNTNSMVYQARFNNPDWTGELLAYSIDPVDGSIAATPSWDAANLIPSENSRNIFSYDPQASLTKGIIFEYANLGANQIALINADSLGSLRVDYIRGDVSTEQRNGGAFRDRTSLMGDIVNSDPWFSGNTEDFGYSGLSGTEGITYSAFKNTKLGRTPALYFAANDAMLHAINATSGAELFTYIPNETIGSLSILSDPLYGCNGASCIQHKYFVDGSPRVSDAYFDSTWHSVLVGTLAAGGKGLFALDVTTPSSFSAADVLWEISTTQAPGPSADLSDFASNLGYTLPQASIVRMQDGSWAAIVANGYESANNKAVLYIIDIKTGHILKSIDTGAGSAASPNGLSTPIAVDEDGDHITDSIFAGDLLGNMWKFDVSSSNPNSWDVAHKVSGTPTPHYIALDSSGVRQPITSKPQVGRHPNGGLMIYFGTGKYYANNDQIIGPSPQVQTFYGIRDAGSIVADRSVLQKQTILAESTLTIPATVTPPAPAFDIDVRVTTDTLVPYPTKEGWYMDLISPVNGAEGERVVSNPLLRNGRIIFSTMTPNPDPCDWGGSSWLMELDAVNGKRLDGSPFDVNNDGNIDLADLVHIYDTNGDGIIDASDDIAVSGIRKKNLGIIKTPSVVTCEDGTECKYLSGSSGQLDMVKESSGAPTGRQSWRQLR